MNHRTHAVVPKAGRPTLRCTGRGAATGWVAVRYHVACGSTPVSLDPLDGHGKSLAETFDPFTRRFGL